VQSCEDDVLQALFEEELAREAVQEGPGLAPQARPPPLAGQSPCQRVQNQALTLI
jgi:hypothetical protein